MGEQEACPVCTEPLREDGDDSLRCLNHYRTCLVCAGKIVKPCGECKPATCTGLWFTCPLCTSRSALEPPFKVVGQSRTGCTAVMISNGFGSQSV